jgi:hypothetical protein
MGGPKNVQAAEGTAKDFTAAQSLKCTGKNCDYQRQQLQLHLLGNLPFYNEAFASN